MRLAAKAHPAMMPGPSAMTAENISSIWSSLGVWFILSRSLSLTKGSPCLTAAWASIAWSTCS
eukprot:9230296-Pyramimonas_sp.AAC.1